MDPLHLPPVPAPAPATHPWRDGVVIAVVAVLLLVMATIDSLSGAAIRLEKRRPSAWPSAKTLRSPAAFAAAFGQAFDDRFGMRSLLILAQHRVLVDIFGVSPVSNVMIGRDGWLFWLGEDGESLDRHYRGTRWVSDFEADAYVAEVRRRHEYLRRRGIAYLTVIVPEKFTIYPEYLPSWVHPGDDPTLLARTIDRLAKDGTVPYVDLRPLLREAKSRERLYYMTDSHWNLAGGAVGYLAIMRAVQTLLPGRIPSIAPPVRPPYVPGRDVFWGDLAQMIGIPGEFVEPDYLPLYKARRDPAGLGLRARLVTPDIDAFKVYAQPDASLPRLIMDRDSMGNALMPMLAENFSQTTCLVTATLDREQIDNVHPDIVIDEIVERGMVRLAKNPLR